MGWYGILSSLPSRGSVWDLNLKTHPIVGLYGFFNGISHGRYIRGITGMGGIFVGYLKDSSNK